MQSEMNEVTETTAELREEILRVQSELKKLARQLVEVEAKAELKKLARQLVEVAAKIRLEESFDR